MNLDAALVAIIGAAAGAMAAGTGAYIKSRLDVRTAARLVYAELHDNTSVASYFLVEGVWPTADLRHVAWNRYAEVIAKKRDDSFWILHEGYSALEGLAYLGKAQNDKDRLSEKVRRDLAKEAMKKVVQALHTVGAVAGLEKGELMRRVADVEKLVDLKE